MVSRYEVQVRRAYDVPEPADGARVKRPRFDAAPV